MPHTNRMLFCYHVFAFCALLERWSGKTFVSSILRVHSCEQHEKHATLVSTQHQLSSATRTFRFFVFLTKAKGNDYSVKWHKQLDIYFETLWCTYYGSREASSLRHLDAREDGVKTFYFSHIVVVVVKLQVSRREPFRANSYVLCLFLPGWVCSSLSRSSWKELKSLFRHFFTRAARWKLINISNYMSHSKPINARQTKHKNSIINRAANTIFLSFGRRQIYGRKSCLKVARNENLSVRFIKLWEMSLKWKI